MPRALRMLALGFPVTVATGFATGYLLLPGLSVWVVRVRCHPAACQPVRVEEAMPQLIKEFTFRAGFGDIRNVGVGPFDDRTIITVRGGRFRGARLNGHCRIQRRLAAARCR